MKLLALFFVLVLVQGNISKENLKPLLTPASKLKLAHLEEWLGQNTTSTVDSSSDQVELTNCDKTHADCILYPHKAWNILPCYRCYLFCDEKTKEQACHDLAIMISNSNTINQCTLG